MSNIIALYCKLLPICLPICNQACREDRPQHSLVSMYSFNVVTLHRRERSGAERSSRPRARVGVLSWNIAQISNFPFIVGSGSKTLRFFGKGILVIGVTGSGIIAGGSFGSAVPAVGILRAYFSRRLSATKRPVERVMNHACMAY